MASSVNTSARARTLAMDILTHLNALDNLLDVKAFGFYMLPLVGGNDAFRSILVACLSCEITKSRNALMNTAKVLDVPTNETGAIFTTNPYHIHDAILKICNMDYISSIDDLHIIITEAMNSLIKNFAITCETCAKEPHATVAELRHLDATQGKLVRIAADCFKRLDQCISAVIVLNKCLRLNVAARQVVAQQVSRPEVKNTKVATPHDRDILRLKFDELLDMSRCCCPELYDSLERTRRETDMFLTTN